MLFDVDEHSVHLVPGRAIYALDAGGQARGIRYAFCLQTQIFAYQLEHFMLRIPADRQSGISCALSDEESLVYQLEQFMLLVLRADKEARDVPLSVE